MQTEMADQIEHGQRRRLPMWWVLAVGVLVVAVIAGATAPRWLANPEASTGAPTVAGRRGGSPPPEAATAESAAFDPMRRVISLGRVPGLQLTGSLTARYFQVATLEDDDGSLMVEVLAYPRGHGAMYFSPQGLVDPSKGIPADPVGGAPAYWMPDGQRLYQYEAARLAWQWGDGGWVFVTAASTDDQGRQPKVPAERLRTMARTTAEAVRVDSAGTPVTIPFTMPPPPAGYRLTGTHLLRGTRTDGKPLLRATLEFDTDGDRANPGNFARDAGPGLAVTATLSTPNDKPGSVNRTVEGHPVSEREGGVTLYDAGEGFAIEVGGGGLDVARSVTILPGARDESFWTDKPIR